MRIAIVKKDKCQAPRNCDYVCKKYCPRVRTGDQTILIENSKPSIDENSCIGCGICVKKCVFKALTIVNLPEELKLTPLHQYGPNGFRLFGITIPMHKKVLGIVGENGIGKTTLIKILSNQIIPNFSNFHSEGSEDKVLEHFAGKEPYNYFRKLFEKKLKISFKPQHITEIPKYFSGQVITLLGKNETEKLAKLIKLLELEKVKRKNVSELSGGELQRLAIAATLNKEADVYIFDEISSFLDIRQKLNVARIIRSIVKENKSVVVVDHDLILLDYLSDLVSILYGKEGAYGIVTLPRVTRVGINRYISGFLKEENVRMRSEGLVFEKSPPEVLSDTKFVDIPKLSKKLGNFSLKVNKAEIFKNEIIGILGPNAIGKTTFVKLLAGVITPDTGKIKKAIKVAYKPQYLDIKSDTLVKDALLSVSEDLLSGWHKKTILQPLRILDFLNKKISELSGGEIQRVAIACTLGRSVDMYLFDEPTAFLDVDQRIKVAKIIKKFVQEKNVTALIVDHDLLFIDYLSDKLMVFLGMPALQGETFGPMELREGMNIFLKNEGITLRRDIETNRPRVNKVGSVKDREQKEKGEYYYEK